MAMVELSSVVLGTEDQTIVGAGTAKAEHVSEVLKPSTTLVFDGSSIKRGPTEKRMEKMSVNII